MKKIKFFTLGNAKSFHFWLFVFSHLMLLLHIIEMFFFEKMTRYIAITAYSSMSIYYLTPFFYKNFVQWNKKGITLKLNTLIFTRTFSFEDIQSVEFSENELKVAKTNDVVRTLDLTGIAPESIERLKAIFQQRCVKFYSEEVFS